MLQGRRLQRAEQTDPVLARGAAAAATPGPAPDRFLRSGTGIIQGQGSLADARRSGAMVPRPEQFRPLMYFSLDSVEIPCTIRHSALRVGRVQAASAAHWATGFMGPDSKLYDRSDHSSLVWLPEDGAVPEQARTAKNKAAPQAASAKQRGAKRTISQRAPLNQAAVPRTAAAGKKAVSRNQAAPAKETATTRQAATERQAIRKGV